MKTRIGGLLNTHTVTAAGQLIPATRIGWFFNPPQRQEQPNQ